MGTGKGWQKVSSLPFIVDSPTYLTENDGNVLMIDKDKPSNNGQGIWRYCTKEDKWNKLFEIPDLSMLDTDHTIHVIHTATLDTDLSILYLLITEIPKDQEQVTQYIGFKVAKIELNKDKQFNQSRKWDITKCKNESMDVMWQDFIVIRNELHGFGNELHEFDSSFIHLKWNNNLCLFERIGTFHDKLYHAKLILDKVHDTLCIYGSIKYNAFDFKFYEYHFETNQWYKLKIKLPTKLRQSFGCLMTMHQKIILFGGLDHQLRMLNDIYVSSSLSNVDCYQSKLKCPMKGECKSCITSNIERDKLIVIGFCEHDSNISMDIISLICEYYRHNQLVHFFHNKGHWIIHSNQCLMI